MAISEPDLAPVLVEASAPRAGSSQLPVIEIVVGAMVETSLHPEDPFDASNQMDRPQDLPGAQHRAEHGRGDLWRLNDGKANPVAKM